MANYSKIFSKVPVEIPNKSGFDMSHENLLTGKVGTLIPVMVDELLPNDTISLGVSSQLQLPPMATDFYGRVRGKFEAFFVPNRVLYGGWQELITHPVNGDVYPSGSSTTQKAKYLPSLSIMRSECQAGSLADYLGFKSRPSTSGPTDTVKIPNCLPFVAYHKIWDDWYRDSRIQVSAFDKFSNGTSTAVSGFSQIPYVTNYSSSPFDITGPCADGVSCFSLRQRNWSRDYFTNSTTAPQAGAASTLAFSVEDGTGAFTIASLRAANSLQQWLERNNIAGYRYGDQIKAQFGIYPADATTDRSIYLGSTSFDVYNKSVYMDHPSEIPDYSRNPFNITGSKYGSPIGTGDGSLVDKFTASEHGFIFVMFSLVPDALYATGTRRYLGRSSSGDFAFPILAGVGDQKICTWELSRDLTANQINFDSSEFGYTQRYSEYKFMLDEVHGLLRTGGSLESFALSRDFAQTPYLGSQFLQIPTNFLDEVSAVDEYASDYGYWADMYFSYKKSSTLPAYSIPTLGDMKDTHTEVIDNGGKRL